MGASPGVAVPGLFLSPLDCASPRCATHRGVPQKALGDPQRGARKALLGEFVTLALGHFFHGVTEECARTLQRW